MSTTEALLHGLMLALQPENLMWGFIGCFLGNFVGVLPGLGSSGAIAILLPVTAILPPTPAIIMLTGIFYGSNYGGTITTVLLNIPGEAATAITALDGNPMAKAGRAGAALGIAAIGSFVGGSIATVLLAFGAPSLAKLGLMMGPAERCALMIFALCLLAMLLGRKAASGMAAALLGLLIASVGIDPVMGMPRFTFGQPELLDGINFVAAVMGLFGMSEVFVALEQRLVGKITENVGPIMPTREDLRVSVKPILRGTVIGSLIGMIPGTNSALASFLAYGVETSVAKDPSRFGKGAIEGVASPETANNAFANANFIPLLALGIPGTASLAILMGGMMMYGLAPGPFLFRDNPDIVWAVIASMFVGNLILLILNLPLASMWIQMLRVRYSLLAPVIVLFTLVGSYSISSSMVSVWTTLTFGIIGFGMKKFDLPIAPMVLTMVLGPLLEANLRRALTISRGDFSVFFNHPISAVILVAAALVLTFLVLRLIFARSRTPSFDSED
ncbi:putative tricarboxylic transport membrane protein [Xaviernesmea oryzae]|uniref:Putative tricarboxylic transport membrane protein n=1 Tax=Xaviernesmea oryzae TaxID=464029 RepID=A0A1X7FNY8_9HYPH|nr:tripartite tricarboxylate transporter permease [Xaviernesmea oryzae]SMF56020.1 putative tricarboxylic transport membrane protein [Xaviernesmea oryzae]